MGAGDEIMLTAQVRAMFDALPVKVLVADKHGRPRWHQVWENNPKIASASDVARGVRMQVLKNHGGARPYIANHTPHKWIWNKKFRVEPGEIFLSDHERKLSESYRATGPYLVIEPNVKAGPGGNKDWGFGKWQAVVFALSHIPFVQTGAPHARTLQGVRRIQTDQFRSALPIIAGSRGYVGAEGGLHHATAAFGLPAVVIFGGFIAPSTTGYPTHRNLYRPEGSPCGNRVPCGHCRGAMAAITVDEVIANVSALWSEGEGK